MRVCSSGCFGTVFCIFILLGIIGIPVGITLSSIYGIRDLGYLVEDVRFSALNLTSAISNYSTQLNGEIDFVVRISNPSRGTGIYFKRITMETSYNGLILGDCLIPPFYLGHKTRVTRTLNLTTNVTLDGDEAASLRSAIAANAIRLYVDAVVELKCKIGSQKCTTVTTSDTCDNVEVSPPSSPGGSRLLNKCSMKFRIVNEYSDDSG